jgi:hypothetical protein
MAALVNSICAYSCESTARRRESTTKVLSGCLLMVFVDRGIIKLEGPVGSLALYRFDIRAGDRDGLAVVAGDLSDAYLDFALE